MGGYRGVVSAPEPVTALAARAAGRTVFRQGWHELSFLHWRVDVARLAPLLPPGVRPDEHDGSAWVGLVPFRMSRVGILRGPGVPWFGTFCETNVRTYSVDRQGRRGVVFLSLDAERLAPVLVGRAAGLPYLWSRMRLHRDGGTLRYECRRRWPGPRGTASRIAVRPGAPVEAGALELFLTARWGLHAVGARGRTFYWPNEHPGWPLRAATVETLDDELLAAAGLPGLDGSPPDSVLFSPGVQARFGPRLPC
jgi:uncharacterized protein YqjF (DUF2071 family)